MASVPWYGIKEKIRMYAADVPEGQIFYHGTRAALRAGDLLSPGFGSNFVQRELKHVYFSATLEAATWGAELAKGEGRGRIYIVEPTGPFEDDPNLTDKKFPGNVTASYRTLDPLRVVGEVEDWVGHSPEQLQAMRDGLQRLNDQGLAEIEE
jgi:rifampin ADP-ribosylating transferase